MRILLLGGNGFGKVHARSYRNLGIQFSVFSRNHDVLKEYKNDYGVLNTFSDIDEAINSEYDAVDIVLPHNLHLKYAREAMKRGRHVLIEKPIASTVEEAREMISLAGENKVKFMVAEQYFFDSALKEIEKLLSHDAIGKVHTIIIRDQRLYTKKGWRAEQNAMGGGSLIDGGIHYIEAMLDLGGPVSKMNSSVYHGGSSLEGEDNALAMFTFENGAHGFFYYSWAYPYAPRLPAYEIIGTEGSIVEDLETKPRVDFKYQDVPRHAFGLPVVNGEVLEGRIKDVFDEEISGFLNSIENKTDVPYQPELALRNLEAIMEIYKSA